MLVCTRNFLTFANTTAIAYGRKAARSLKIFAVCNSGRVCKRQKITSSLLKQSTRQGLLGRLTIPALNNNTSPGVPVLYRAVLQLRANQNWRAMAESGVEMILSSG